MSEPGPQQFKCFLGDAVYASWDGGHIVLTAENGGRVLQRIAMGYEVWKNLQIYHARLQLWVQQQHELAQKNAGPVP